MIETYRSANKEDDVEQNQNNKAFVIKQKTDEVLQQEFRSFVEFVDRLISEASNSGEYEITLNSSNIKYIIYPTISATEYEKFNFRMSTKYYNQFFNYYKNQGFKIELKNWFMAYFFNSICEIEISWKNLK